MSITASVVGTAYAFADDTVVLDHFVASKESEIRKKSDKAHARVRAEREAKQRAEDERRARESREAAEKARREAIDARAPKRPWEVGVEMTRTSDILRGSKLFDSIATQ